MCCIFLLQFLTTLKITTKIYSHEPRYSSNILKINKSASEFALRAHFGFTLRVRMRNWLQAKQASERLMVATKNRRLCHRFEAYNWHLCMHLNKTPPCDSRHYYSLLILASENNNKLQKEQVRMGIDSIHAPWSSIFHYDYFSFFGSSQTTEWGLPFTFKALNDCHSTITPFFSTPLQRGP